MNDKTNKQCFKKLLQEVHHENVSLKTIFEFRAKYPDTLWTEVIYSKTGDSILHVAARLGEENIVSYILEKWPPLSVDIKNHDCKTPLHEAAQFSQQRIIEILLNYSPEVDAIKRADWTPLMLACTKGGECAYQTVSNILKAGASCKLTNKDGWTSLHLACRTGDIKIAKLLLNHDSELNESRTKNGRTMLHIACLHGNLDVVELLLKYKVSVNVSDKCGNTPLHDAVCSDSQNLVRVLVEHNADVDAVNNVGLGCVHIAAGAGLVDMLQFLIKDLNMNPNVVTESNMTPLHCAARNKRTDVIDILKQLGADSTVKDVHKRTAHDYLKLCYKY